MVNYICICCKTRTIYSRKNCRTCYKNHMRMIKAGETTWEQLVSSGKAAEAKKPEHPPGIQQMWNEWRGNNNES